MCLEALPQFLFFNYLRTKNSVVWNRDSFIYLQNGLVSLVRTNKIIEICGSKNENNALPMRLVGSTFRDDMEVRCKFDNKIICENVGKSFCMFG